MGNFIHNIFSVTRVDDTYKLLKILFIKHKYIAPKYKSICFLEPGGIGDYLFCRPYFKYIKQSPLFKNLNVILLTKKYYTDMTTAFDYEYFDEIIEYDTTKLINKKYRKEFVKNINLRKIKYLINLRTAVISHEQDWVYRYLLAKNIKAETKITGLINIYNKKQQLKDKMLKIYDKIIVSDLKDAVFELERRRRFFEELLQIPIPEEKISIPVLFDKTKKMIAISMFAEDKNREFSVEKWKQIVEYILSSTDFYVVFLGRTKEHEYIQQLIKSFQNKSHLIDYAGKISISFLPTFLAGCEMLLAVETGTVHIANAVGCKTICLCNGSFYGRFQPYNDNIVKYIYPPDFQKLIGNKSNSLIDFYNINNTFRTDEISVTSVIDTFNCVMKENNIYATKRL